MRRFLAAVRFLTFLPAGRGGDTEARDLGRSVAFFPLVGALLGLLLAGAHIALAPLFPPLASAAIVIVFLIMLTGGLHLDGLADTFDGFYGGRDKEEILRIMKDSRIGVMGTVAIVAALLLKVSLVAGIPAGKAAAILLFMPVAGRWGMALASHRFVPAGEGGLARAIAGGVGRPGLVAATVFTGIVGIGLLRWAGAAACVAVALGSCVVARHAARRIGGMSGDVFGAVNEVSEILALAVVVGMRSWEFDLFTFLG